MPPRRNPRTGVEDRWHRADKSPSANYGKGLRWRARWVEADGRERAKGFARKVDAQAHVDAVTTQVTRGEYVAPEGPETLLRALTDQWLAGLTVKRSTRLSYESMLRAHVLPRWGDVPLKGITPSGVRSWLAEIQAGDDAVTAGYALKVGRVLSMVLSAAVGDRMLARNPVDAVKLPKQGPARRGYSLTEKQLAELMKHMPTASDRTLTAVLGYGGLRWGEAIALTAGVLDSGRGRVHVERAYVDLAGKVSLDTPKDHELRWVPLPPFLMDRLTGLAESRGPGDDLFTNRRGNPLLGSNWLRRVYRPALRAAGIGDEQKRWIHDLRHTYASLAVQAGANIKQLQRAMGHASAAMTLDTYADLFDEDFADLGGRLEPTADVLRTMEPKANDET